MTRGLLLSVLVGMGVGGAGPARAAPQGRLDVTLSPVGAFTTWGPGARTSGYTAGLAWRFQRPGASFSVGGHTSSSRPFSEATPVAIRVTPLPGHALQPFLGAGGSLLVVHRTRSAPSALRLGVELSGGLDLTLGEQLFLVAEARLQDFSLKAMPLASERLLLGSAHLGMGMRL